jgi:hypothetical protein
MPQRDPGVYLEDIEHYSAAAVRFTSELSLEASSPTRRPAQRWKE